MKKNALVAAISFLFAFTNLSAQTKDPAMAGKELEVGLDVAFLRGDAARFYNTGAGGSIQFQMPIAEKLKFTASAGYLGFSTKKIETGFGTTAYKLHVFEAIPVKAGLRYFFGKNIYAGAELGAAFSTNGNEQTLFIYTPNFGIEFPVSKHGSIDLGLREEAWVNDGTSRFLGLRLAYNFGL